MTLVHIGLACAVRTTALQPAYFHAHGARYRVQARLNKCANLLRPDLASFMSKLQVVVRDLHSASLLVRAAYQAVDLNWDRVLSYYTVSYMHMMCNSLLAWGNDTIGFGPTEMDPNPVINGDSRSNAIVEQKSMVRRTTLSFSVIVRAATPRQEAKAVERQELVSNGISDPLLEPAERACAPTGKHNAGLPRFSENVWQSPFSPDRQHAAGIAASDINHILLQQVGSQIYRSAAKEQEMRGAAR